MQNNNEADLTDNNRVNHTENPVKAKRSFEIKMGITSKFLTIIFLSVTVSSFILALFVYQNINRSNINNIAKEYHIAANQIANAYQQKLATVDTNLKLISQNSLVFSAITAFSFTISDFENPAADLQKLYMTDNPEQNRGLINNAGDGSSYSISHEAYQPWFYDILTKNGYADILLMSVRGDVLYSVTKNADFAVNVTTPEWQDTGLGQIFAKTIASAAQADAEEVIHANFDNYLDQPTPSAFASTIIRDVSGNVRSVLVIRTQTNFLRDILTQYIGTDEYAAFIDADGTIIASTVTGQSNSSEKIDVNEKMQTSFNDTHTDADSGNALQHHTDANIESLNVTLNVQGLDGRKKLRTYDMVNHANNKTGVIIDVDYDKIYQQGRAIRIFTLQILIVILLFWLSYFSRCVL